MDVVCRRKEGSAMSEKERILRPEEKEPKQEERRKPETENRRPEAESQKLEAENRRLEESRKPETQREEDGQAKQPLSPTWAQECIEDIDDWIESQGIYLRQ